MNPSYGKRLASKLVPLFVASLAFFFYAASIDCAALTHSVIASLTPKDLSALTEHDAVSRTLNSVLSTTSETNRGDSDPRCDQLFHEDEGASWFDTIDDIRYFCVLISLLLSAYFLLGRETNINPSKIPLWLRTVMVVVIPFAVNSFVVFARDNFGPIGGGL